MIRIKRIYKSFYYASKGMLRVIREEQNIKLQIAAGVLVFILGAYLGLDRIEWTLLFLVSGLVIILETVNSAVERVSDVLKPRINSYVKEIKDIMSAAVMFASFLALVVGLIIFWPHIFSS